MSQPPPQQSLPQQSYAAPPPGYAPEGAVPQQQYPVQLQPVCSAIQKYIAEMDVSTNAHQITGIPRTSSVPAGKGERGT
jgi:hypothetical protein